MTDQRRIIVRVLLESQDHPDVDAVYKRVSQIDSKISLATVYRTLRLLEEVRSEVDMILVMADLNEDATCQHHDHLIDTHTGKIIEFHDERIETLQKEIAHDLGYQLVGHRLELY